MAGKPGCNLLGLVAFAAFDETVAVVVAAAIDTDAAVDVVADELAVAGSASYSPQESHTMRTEAVA